MVADVTTSDLPVTKRSRWFWLRVVTSVLFGLLTLLLVVLWVQNNWRHYLVGVPLPAANSELSAWAVDGHVCFGFTKLPPGTPAMLHYFAGDAGEGFYKDGFDFTYDDSSGPDFLGIEVVIPDWLPLIILGGIAIIPWLSWRFSLRTLLIATTLVAVMLGLAVWAGR